MNLKSSWLWPSSSSSLRYFINMLIFLRCSKTGEKAWPCSCCDIQTRGKNKRAQCLEQAGNKAANFIWQKVMMGSASVIPLEAKQHKIVSGGDVCRTAALVMCGGALFELGHINHCSVRWGAEIRADRQLWEWRRGDIRQREGSLSELQSWYTTTALNGAFKGSAWCKKKKKRRGWGWGLWAESL